MDWSFRLFLVPIIPIQLNWMGHGNDDVIGVNHMKLSKPCPKEPSNMNADPDSEAKTSIAGTRNGTRDLHVKAIPESTWCRARCNATRSGMSFKEYMIRILEACQPISKAETPTPST